MEAQFECKCGWKGNESELNYQSLDNGYTSGGDPCYVSDDRCPECGDYPEEREVLQSNNLKSSVIGREWVMNILEPYANEGNMNITFKGLVELIRNEILPEFIRLSTAKIDINTPFFGNTGVKIPTLSKTETDTGKIVDMPDLSIDAKAKQSAEDILKKYKDFAYNEDEHYYYHSQYVIKAMEEYATLKVKESLNKKTVL